MTRKKHYLFIFTLLILLCGWTMGVQARTDQPFNAVNYMPPQWGSAARYVAWLPDGDLDNTLIPKDSGKPIYLMQQPQENMVTITYTVDEGATMKSATYYDRSTYNYIAFQSGGNIPKGVEVDFEVELQKGYKVDVWYLNNQPVASTKGKKTYTFTVNENSTIRVAITATPKQKVTYSAGAGGSIEAAIIGSPFASGDEVPEGSYITFTATPDEGFVVDKWLINGSENPRYTGKSSIYERLGSAPLKVEVLFKQNRDYTVTYTAQNDWGTLAATYNKPNGAEVNVTSGMQVPIGTEIFFTATPNEGFIIDGWTCNGNPVDSYNEKRSYSIVVRDDVTIVVNAHQIPKYVVTYNSSATGGAVKAYYQQYTPVFQKIEVLSGAEINSGTRVTFEATPKEGYSFKYWIVNGTKVDNDEKESEEQRRMTIVKITSVTTVEAVFAKDEPTFVVTYSAGTGGSLSAILTKEKTAVKSGDRLPQYSYVTFKAKPDNGYVVDQWMVDGQNQQLFAGKPELPRTVRKDMNVTVSFKAETPNKQCTINYTKDNEWGTLVAYYDKQGGRVNIQPGEQVEAGYMISFRATVKEGYTIDHWTYNGEKTPTPNPEILSVKATKDMTVAVVCTKVEPCIVIFDEDVDGGKMKAYYLKDEGFSGYKEVYIKSGGEVPPGTKMTFEVTLNEGFELDHWEVNDEKKACDKYKPLRLADLVITDNTYVHPVYKAKQKPQYKVSFTADNEWGSLKAFYYDNGKQCNVNPEQTVIEGTFVEFIATLKEDYVIDSWTCNGEPLATADNLKPAVTVKADSRIEAQYHKIVKFAVNYEATSEKGSVKATYLKNTNFQYIATLIASGDMLPAQTKVTFEATPLEGYEFDYWTLNGQKAVESEKTKLEGTKMIITLEQNITVAAFFKGDGPKAYGIDIAGNPITSANVEQLDRLEGVSVGDEGYIRYDAETRKLSLKNVTLEAPSALLFAKSNDNFTVELSGTNNLTGQLSTESNLTIMGQGKMLVANEERSGISVGSGASLVIKGKECFVEVKTTSETGVGAIHGVWSAGCTLRIEDASINAESVVSGTAEVPFPYAIGGFKQIELVRAKISVPEEGVAGNHSFTFGGKDYTLAFVLDKASKPASLVKINYSAEAMDAFNNATFIAYPNPFTDHIVIKVPEQAVGQTAFLTNMRGETVKQVKLLDATTVIDAESVPSGIYLLRINEYTQLLVKE